MITVTWGTDEGPKGTNIGGLGGIFANGMRWNDYLEHEANVSANHPDHLEALRQSIITNRIWVDGRTHQHEDNYVPTFSDGKWGSWSWRAWGDLMAAVWSTELDQDLSYLDFYMGTPDPPWGTS